MCYEKLSEGVGREVGEAIKQSNPMETVIGEFQKVDEVVDLLTDVKDMKFENKLSWMGQLSSMEWLE